MTKYAVPVDSFMVGYESTAVGNKLQAELATVLGGRTPTFADLPYLKYTRMVIDETFLLYLPLPPFFRTSYGSDQLSNYDLPPNSAILISLYATNRDPAD